MKAKRVIIFMLAFAMLFSVSAFADIAYEPQDNFYERHRDECDYENRWYITNGSEGCVVVYSSPTGSAKTAIPNGVKFYVSYTWNGEWGCIEYDPSTLEHAYDKSSGWVKMTDMVPEYDTISFMEDHADEIVTTDRVLRISGDEEFIGYKYPGSGIISTTIGNYSGNEFTEVYLQNIYTDAEGREWGYVGYFFGHRNFWICLDEPTAQLAAGAEFTEPEIIPAAGEKDMKDTLRAESPVGTYAIAGAVGAVVIAAAVIAYIIIKKKK